MEVFKKITKKYQHEWEAAKNTALQHEMTVESRKKTRSIISEKISDYQKWVLVGGPPCQAYSLVGRSRRTNETRKKFDSDHRHTLYEEYLDILKHFQPSVFIMENVKGILSATHRGSGIFHRICEDLSKTGYELHALSGHTSKDRAGNWISDAFIIRAEEHGVPQRRHRVFIVGVRKDFRISPKALLSSDATIDIAEALAGIPPLRSRLSTNDSILEWEKARLYGVKIAGGHCGMTTPQSSGAEFVESKSAAMAFLGDRDLGGIPNHQSRSHIVEDIERYAFAASFGKIHGRSPKIGDFPSNLKPKHKNIDKKEVPFLDRFKVQLENRPSSTITSHISKDGHYYIHPDPAQARSLTVREAARLQTFPDNYRFEGPRTEQYKQVGNAVPPLLAKKIARIVAEILSK
jgi:DNA (cytosine-5)-methyltransferase 1